jgi:hypothetical protein
MPRRSFQLRQGVGFSGGVQGSVLRSATVDDDRGLRGDLWVDLPDEPQLGYLNVTPDGYYSARISWNVEPAVTWLEVVIVASLTGEPLTILDGRLVAHMTPSNVRYNLLDSPLQPAVWYYYSLFVRLTDGPNLWYERLSTTQVLIPNDWGSTQMLWMRIPEYYRLRDVELGGGGENVGPLYKFLSLLAWEIDYARTLIYTVSRLNNPEMLVDHALREFGHMLGLKQDVGDLGTTRYRVLASNVMHLRKYKGTLDGIEGYIAAVSGYRADITVVSPTQVNIRMYAQRTNLVQNPKFQGGTATWTVSPPGGVTVTTPSNILTIANASGVSAATVLLTNLFSAAPGIPYALGLRLDEFNGTILIEALWNGTTPATCSLLRPAVVGTVQQRISTQALVAPAATANARFRITITHPTGTNVKLTNVIAEPAQVDERYFDGDTLLGGYLPGGSGIHDFRWEATANASYSYYALDFERTQDIILNVFQYIMPVGVKVGAQAGVDYYVNDWNYFPGKP